MVEVAAVGPAALEAEEAGSGPELEAELALALEALQPAAAPDDVPGPALGLALEPEPGLALEAEQERV